jgi:LL-diaminopimelate aminotransferase
MSILHAGFSKIKREYIFPIIEKKVLDCQKKDLLNLGIGDVALPLIEPAAQAFKKAIEEMQNEPIGYPSSHGQMALRTKICELYYQKYDLTPSDIFISDGINSDLGNLQELFSQEASFGIQDPTYPVPLDVCYMAGRYENTRILKTEASCNFLPSPPDFKIDVVYLCTPNNPTGTAMTKEELRSWIHWAHCHDSILIFDAAYIDFIQDSDIPKTIYEIEGAHTCCIELRSFSKSCGFTGLRCSFSVVPSTLKGGQLQKLWAKRMATKSNGVSYPVQKAALACLSEQGLVAASLQVNHYLKMALMLKSALTEAGFKTYGAINAPYVFVKCPEGFTSWEFFDYILSEASIISVPGSGFGQAGEGYIRFSGFITLETCQRACERLRKITCFV